MINEVYIKPKYIQLRMGLRVSMRKENDCINCSNYQLRDSKSLCKKKYSVIDWEGDIDILSDDFDFELDDDFGTYRIDENNNRIDCEHFKKKIKGDRTKAWRKKKYGKFSSEIPPYQI